ncbi:P-loop NTPase [Kurthia massiliensis]|uniref:P-loop NTPase n=1 Tax=Kurthia massiliensis TaxID=1033739 RepID=UPI00028834C9|nr:P-loop NTPase [Kurthia massiliensis]
MINEQQVYELLGGFKDPILHKTLAETNGVLEVRIKEEKEHVSVKVAIAKLGTPEQLTFQMDIVNELKEAGFKTVGIRFAELDPSVLESFRGNATRAEAQDLLSPLSNTKFISIASGKGGVGKSTVSVNLAVALSRLGKKVGLIDADIYGFSVPDMMGVQDMPRVENDRIFPVERFGVKMISMGFFVENNAPVVWRGPMLGKVLDQFFRDVEWGELDYLLLDLPPGTGDVALDIHQMLPESYEIVVTTPHPTAAFVAARAGAMAIKTQHHILGVVENMSWFQSEVSGQKEFVFGKGGGTKLASELRTELLGQIPLGQPEIIEADFAPSVYARNHSTGQLYIEMAQNVIDKLNEAENK